MKKKRQLVEIDAEMMTLLRNISIEKDGLPITRIVRAACLYYVAADAIYRGETLGQFLRRVDAGKNMTPEALQVFSKSYVNVRSKKSE
jgi:predicted transcriptional regulator